jgi:hypothetical protein
VVILSGIVWTLSFYTVSPPARTGGEPWLFHRGAHPGLSVSRLARPTVVVDPARHRRHAPRARRERGRVTTVWPASARIARKRRRAATSTLALLDTTDNARVKLAGSAVYGTPARGSYLPASNSPRSVSPSTHRRTVRSQTSRPAAVAKPRH